MIMRLVIHVSAALALVTLAAGCTARDRTDGGDGADAPGAIDAGSDVGTDAASEVGADAGTDAAVDVAVDASMDGGLDGVAASDTADAAGQGDPGGDAGDAGDAGDTSGFDYPCEPGTLEACVTACGSAGKHMCLKKWGPCIPPGEYCGNCVDDDCDGLVNEDCPPNPECLPPLEPECPTAVITIAEILPVFTDTVLHLSAAASTAAAGASVVAWQWSVETPAGAAGGFVPSATVESPTFPVDVAGQYLFHLDVWDSAGLASCISAVAAAAVQPYPPLAPEVGCADGAREGFLDTAAYPQIAGCAGAWDQPGITPDTVAPTCARQGGDDGPHPEGGGCSAPDLCADAWHVCSTWNEVAAKSPTGCAGATPPGAKPKSLFFAIRQPSVNGSVCGAPGSGFNDVFGCGNLGAGLGSDKGCGPLDRVLASTQPDSCGFNEAEPNLGPWQCIGGPGSDLLEGQNVTKKGCPGTSCSYDGYPVGNSDKGGVLCCRD